MTEAYRQIQPLVFSLDRADLPPCQAYQLHLPPQWRSEILAAARQRSDREEVTAPHRSLHAVLRATLPALIHVSYRAWRSAQEGRTAPPWLLATEPVDPAMITMVVQSWLRKEFDDLPALGQLLARITADALSWQPVTVVLGTEGPTGLDFQLLPHLVAASLAQDGVEARIGPARLTWYRVAAPPEGAELVSWPPLEYHDGKHTWHYSYVLTLTVQTLPFNAEGYLHVDAGIRRWATRFHRPPRGKTSVYLHAPESWLGGDGRRALCVAPIGWEYLGPKQFRGEWQENLPAILAHSHHLEMPDADAISWNPEAFLRKQEIQAAMAFGHWKDRSHRVGTGANPADRKLIFRHLCEQFPWLKPAAPLEKIPVKAGRSKQKNRVLPEQRAAALYQFAGDEAIIEIWYRDTHVPERLKQAMQTLLGAVPLGDGRYRTPMGRFTIREYLLPDTLTAALPVPSGPKIAERAQAATEKRAEEVKRYVLEKAGHPVKPATLAFVQIEDQSSYTDAKRAIRGGFARAGRLTQCLFGKDKGDPKAIASKYANTCQDLLRQTGCLPRPLSEELGEMPAGLPFDTVVTSIWLIRRNDGRKGRKAFLPVAVRTRLDRTAVEAKVLGMGGWRPYHELLLGLTREETLALPVEKVRAGIRQFLGETGSRTTLLLVEAHNLRQVWPWLGNGQMRADVLTLDDSGVIVYHPADLPGLRVVRIRDHERHETPQWFAFAGEASGVTDGLFRVSERVAHSIAPKSKTMRALTSRPKPEAPTVTASMPALLEVSLPFLQEGDEPVALARLVHRLRLAHPHFDDPTVLPVPLHLAAQMAEYLVQVPDEEGEV